MLRGPNTDEEAGRKFFVVNRNIRLRIPSGKNFREFQEYTSRIEEVTNDSYQVSYPLSKGHLVEVLEGQLLEVLGTDGAVFYRFRTRVREVSFGAVPLLILNQPETIERIERRNWFRLSVLIELRLWATDSDEVEPLANQIRHLQYESRPRARSGRSERFERNRNPVVEHTIDELGLVPEQAISGYAIDLSGSGVQLSCDVGFDPNQTLFLELKLDQTEVWALGRIVDVRERGHSFRYGVEFLNMDPRQRDKIVKFIFAKQIERRKKGLM